MQAPLDPADARRAPVEKASLAVRLRASWGRESEPRPHRGHYSQAEMQPP